MELSHEMLVANRSSADSVEQPTSRHMCHCGKSFIRKEHLRRHQATHGERNFVCPVCQRSFTRNDLLRRHLTRHDMPSAPDPRRGRACDACHANKTKCDGGTKCTLCIKRGINCTYNHASKSSSGSKSPSDDAPDSRSVPHSSAQNRQQQEAIAATANVTLGTPQLSPNDEVRAGLKRIANHLRSGEIPIGEDLPIPPLDQNWIESNSKEYFGRFHNTWPIFHAPSYFPLDASFVVTVSVAMISCWLKSPDEFGEAVMQVHEAFMDKFFEWIMNPGQYKHIKR
ncbi:hypothetical protein NW762_003654 [Fusarium torreyae]|uniref:Uncharacterized protein n=1 Tax=Fusarium torreyae TaxID=1237075 RepID=A0A9W8VJA9_9HYPO|nr:hypothetical protein NW762_003654 [Fusarium torreyae]